MEDLKKFYEINAADIGEESPAVIEPAGSLDMAKSTKSPVRRKERLEKQLQVLQEHTEMKKVIELTNGARVDATATEDSPNHINSPVRLEALTKLVKEYFRVVLKSKLLVDPERDGYLFGLNEVAMKRLSSDDAEREKQVAGLEKNLALAKKYFPGIELRQIETTDEPPQKVAVFLGVSAEEFNAAVMAEKLRVLYEQREAEIRAGIKEAEMAARDAREERLAAQENNPKIPTFRANEDDSMAIH